MRALINDNVLDLPPYRPLASVSEKPQHGVARLSANENPFPLPESVGALMASGVNDLSRYPDSSSLLLRQALAERHGLRPEQIIVGAGSTELIGMIVSAFLKVTEKVLTSESTFLMYRLATIERAGLGALLETPLREDFAIDLDAMSKRLRERVKLIFLANPNNPTGLRLSGKELAEFASQLDKNTLLVLDNAYQEYTDDPDDEEGMALLRDHDNVIILRTFSKVFGLASLRVGYAMASPRLIDYLNRVKPPFNVSGLGQTVAMTMLSEKHFISASIAHNQRERKRMMEIMNEYHIQVLPSQANFILFMPRMDANKLVSRFRKAGVLLRPGSPFGLSGAIRVSIGKTEENNRFLDVLKQSLLA